VSAWDFLSDASQRPDGSVYLPEFFLFLDLASFCWSRVLEHLLVLSVPRRVFLARCVSLFCLLIHKVFSSDLIKHRWTSLDLEEEGLGPWERFDRKGRAQSGGGGGGTHMKGRLSSPAKLLMTDLSGLVLTEELF